MNIHPTLNESVRIAQGIIDLIKQSGIDEDDDDFYELVASECDALERLKRIVRAARMAEADARKLSEMIEDMKSRKARFGEKAESLRHTAQWAMEELGISKLQAPDFTAGLTKPKPPLIITDETALPDELCRIKREPNKTAIREKLEAGETLDGLAYLGNPRPTLTIRTK